MIKKPLSKKGGFSVKERIKSYMFLPDLFFMLVPARELMNTRPKPI